MDNLQHNLNQLNKAIGAHEAKRTSARRRNPPNRRLRRLLLILLLLVTIAATWITWPLISPQIAWLQPPPPKPSGPPVKMDPPPRNWRAELNAPDRAPRREALAHYAE